MARRANSGSGGCPDYMVTYGDMMSLLLCFFIMLVALSQIKEEDKFRAVLESIRKAFGYTGAKNPVDGSYTDFNSMSLIERIQTELVKKQKRDQAKGKSQSEQSQFGRSTTVRSIRDGLVITVGGLAVFEEGSAVLQPSAKEDLLEVIRIIKGYRNKILVRGHTSQRALPANSLFKDHMGLSYARARAVVQYLIDNEISADRLNIEACAANEPLKTFVYDEEGVARNRRVEIIVKDTMVEDYKEDVAETDEPKK